MWCAEWCVIRHALETTFVLIARAPLQVSDISTVSSQRRCMPMFSGDGAPLGLLLQSDAGVLQSVVCHTAPGASGPIRSVQAVYAPIGDQPLSRFRLRLVAFAMGIKGLMKFLQEHAPRSVKESLLPKSSQRRHADFLERSLKT